MSNWQHGEPRAWRTNPVLLLCMGAEMIYILDQRLLEHQKSCKVLDDVLKSFFGKPFLDSMFTPKPVLVSHQLRSICFQIAHSSIMRVNETSMDKLFDLICMGVKHQTLSTREPHELLAIVMNHLDAIKRIINNQRNQRLDKVVLPLVESCRGRFLTMYNNRSCGEMFLIRQSILNALQDKMVKVSLLLRYGFQNKNGFISIDSEGQLPTNTEIPGLVKHYRNGEVVDKNILPEIRQNQKNIYLAPTTEYKNIIYFQEHCILGENLYDDRNQRKSKKLKKKQITYDSQLGFYNGQPGNPLSNGLNNSEDVVNLPTQMDAIENLFSSTLQKKNKCNDQNQTTNYFQLDIGPFNSNDSDEEGTSQHEANLLTFNTSEQSMRTSVINKSVDDIFSIDNKNTQNDAEDDLLSLMDDFSMN